MTAMTVYLSYSNKTENCVCRESKIGKRKRKKKYENFFQIQIAKEVVWHLNDQFSSNENVLFAANVIFLEMYMQIK